MENGIGVGEVQRASRWVAVVKQDDGLGGSRAGQCRGGECEGSFVVKLAAL